MTTTTDTSATGRTVDASSAEHSTTVRILGLDPADYAAVYAAFEAGRIADAQRLLLAALERVWADLLEGDTPTDGDDGGEG